jgi:hypothetical protein
MKSIVPATWTIPAQLQARLGDGAGRQRAMTADGHLLLVLHEPPGPDDRVRKARLFWRQPSGEWTSSTKGSGPQALKKHLAEFSEHVDRLENRLQEAGGATDYFQLLQAVAPLHRNSRNMHAALQQAREMLPDDRDLIVARDSAGDIERAMELLHTDAKNGLDYTVAHETELQSQRSYEMAVSAHRLNLLAAIFFPIAALSSIFGMNVSHGLEGYYPGPWIFWGTLGVGFVTGLLLTLLIARRPVPPPDAAERKK